MTNKESKAQRGLSCSPDLTGFPVTPYHVTLSSLHLSAYCYHLNILFFICLFPLDCQLL